MIADLSPPPIIRHAEGQSGETRVTDSLWRSFVEDDERTTRGVLVSSALATAIKETRAENWDGYGALPVSMVAVGNARIFLQMLPSSMPSPDVGVDPDGEVSFEWYRGPSRVFSVSIGDANAVSYAGIFGPSRSHGKEYFFDVMPGTIIQHLRRLYGE